MHRGLLDVASELCCLPAAVGALREESSLQRAPRGLAWPMGTLPTSSARAVSTTDASIHRCSPGWSISHLLGHRRRERVGQAGRLEGPWSCFIKTGR